MSFPFDLYGNSVGSNEGGFGGALGYQSTNSASNQASNLSLEELLNVMDYWTNKQTSSQREIQQDFFNQTKEFNANQAQIDRDRQDNAYQILVRDLEKAGLNKLLAYNNGPTNIGSVGASVGTPSSSRGSDISNVLGSLANTNANKATSMFGLLGNLLGMLFSEFGKAIDHIGK